MVLVVVTARSVTAYEAMVSLSFRLLGPARFRLLLFKLAPCKHLQAFGQGCAPFFAECGPLHFSGNGGWQSPDWPASSSRVIALFRHGALKACGAAASTVAAFCFKGGAGKKRACFFQARQ